MSLLNVTVKRASYTGEQASQLNTYVTVKLQNVKSSTAAVKGAEPCWEQDFLFETNNASGGLVVEVCTKGMIWDRTLGYQYITIDSIPYGYPNGVTAKWLPLDAECILVNGEVTGTKDPTGHMIMLDCRFDASQGQNVAANQYQQLGYPYQQQPYGGAMDNSYDYSGYYEDGMGYETGAEVPDNYYDGENYEQEELFYNSRPQKNSWSAGRRGYHGRSLERQETLYDDMYNCTDSYSDYNSVPYQPNNSFDQYDDQYESEDRQWDSGGSGRYTSLAKRLPDVPIRGSTSVTEGLYYSNSRGASLPATPPTHKRTSRALPQPVVTSSLYGSCKKSLPEVPPGAPFMGEGLLGDGGIKPKRMMPNHVILEDDTINSLTQLNSTYNNSSYYSNEDFNYAYQSPEAINDNVYDPYTKKSRSLLPSLPGAHQYGMASPGVSDYRQSSFDLDPYSAPSAYQQPTSSYDDDMYGYKTASTASANFTTTAKSSLTSTIAATLKKLPQPGSILKSTAPTQPAPSKLPPIPNVTTTMYGEPMETRSLHDNDDSQFSRFNSYESESVPYSNSNDLTASMYSQPSTKHDLTYGNGELDDLYYDEPFQQPLPPLDPDVTDISRLAEQNSNLYDYDMEEEITDISKLASFQDEQYNTDYQAATTSAAPVVTTTATSVKDYSNEYYDNCQYEYEYAESETDYLASGDIIDKNKSNLLLNNNNYAAVTTTVATSVGKSLPSAPTSAAQKQQEPNKTASILGQSKSLLGGLGSGLLGGLSSGISNLTTNLTATPAPEAHPANASSSTKMGGGFLSKLTSSVAMAPPATTTTSISHIPPIPTTTITQPDQFGYAPTTKQNGQATILEEYREDFEFDQQPQQEFQGQQNYEYDQSTANYDQMNGYYDNQVPVSQASKKLQEDKFYNTYDDCMVFNEEDEDLYREQLEGEKVDVPLEEYKEDFEEDFLPQRSEPNTSTATSTHYTSTTQVQPQPPVTQQNSFDDYGPDYPPQPPVPTTRASTQRMLTKQDTIMSETTEQLGEYDDDFKEPKMDDEGQYYEEEEEPQDEYQEPLPERKNSELIADPEAMMPPPRPSVTIEEPIMPEKRHEKPKEKMTAKQRWHWAYNKIIMQLNVSLYPHLFEPQSLVSRGITFKSPRSPFWRKKNRLSYGSRR